MYAVIVLAEDLGVRFAFPTQTIHIEDFPGQISLKPTPKPTAAASSSLAESLQKIDQYFIEANSLDKGDDEKIKPLGGA